MCPLKKIMPLSKFKNPLLNSLSFELLHINYIQRDDNGKTN